MWLLSKLVAYTNFEATIWRDGVDATAVVTKVERTGKTKTVRYRFAVPPTLSPVYYGTTDFSSGATAPSFAPGQTIPIKYLRSDPSQSIASDQGDSTAWLLLWSAVLALVSLLPLGSFWWLWRARQLVMWGTPIVATLEKVTVDSTIGPQRKIVTLRVHFCWRDDANRLRRSSMITYVLAPPPQPQTRAIALMSRDGKFAIIYDLCPFEAVP